MYFYKRYEGYTKLEKTYFDDRSLNIGLNKPIFETKRSLNNKSNMYTGYEYYKLNEGAIPPVASQSYGINWTAEYIPANYFKYHPMLQPDKRVVVKAILRFLIKKTGREVVFIKTYLPKLKQNQTLKIKY